jgi:LacI family transcriptional regulator
MPQRKSGHVTMLDVARASGFSVSTVSIVLSDAPLAQNVAATTREHIRAMAQQLGYHPDAHARSLRRRSTQTIGVLAFDLSDPFCVPIMRGIQLGLQPADYLPLVMDAQTQRKLFDDYLNLLLERRAEGVIVIASWVFEETNLLADVRKNNVPIIIVGRDLTARGITSILVDNEDGGALAMTHLRDLGHRQIAVILGPPEMCDSEPRWRGIQRVAREAGIHLDPDLVLELPGLANAQPSSHSSTQPSSQSGAQAAPQAAPAPGPESGFDEGLRCAQQMLSTGKPFTAVLAFDDLTALGVVRGLTEAGLRVPQDVSVMGFDDVLPAKVSTPAITTIRQPLHEMGLHAAEQALLAIKRTTREEKPNLLKANPELIQRASTIRI